MVPVDLVSVVVTLTVLWLAFGHRIPRRYSLAALDTPRSAIKDPYIFRAAFPVLVALLTAYFALATIQQVPFSVVTGAAALVLVAIAGRWWRRGRGAVLPLRRIVRDAPWQIVLFSLGMYLVVYGLGQAGLTHYAAMALEWLAGQSAVIATLGTGFLAALVASVMNNMPATLVGALAIDQAHLPDMTEQLMIYANIIGNDLGPKFTPIGSLATLLWLHVLANKGYRIGWGRYIKVGLVLTPPVLGATLLALVFWLPVVTPAGAL